MEPVPETVAALRRLQPGGTDIGVLSDLRTLTDRVRREVPACIGLSIATAGTPVTLTFVEQSSPLASLEPLAFLALLDEEDDAVTAAQHDAAVEWRDPTDERAWLEHAASEAPVGIASSLSIPLMEGAEVTGTVTFYATEPHAFVGHEVALARLCGAWAPGAVSNSDLSFSSRLRAAAAPVILDDQETVDRATTIAAEELHLSPSSVRRRLRSASVRAGISEVDLARLVITSHDR